MSTKTEIRCDWCNAAYDPAEDVTGKPAWLHLERRSSRLMSKPEEGKRDYCSYQHLIYDLQEWHELPGLPGVEARRDLNPPELRRVIVVPISETEERIIHNYLRSIPPSMTKEIYVERT